MPDNLPDQVKSPELLADIRRMIEETRSAVAATVNAGLTTLYWRVGKQINDEVLQGERAAYGKQIISALGSQLETEFGRGFSEKSLRHMIRFAEAFPDFQIISSLLRQLSWSHFLSNPGFTLRSISPRCCPPTCWHGNCMPRSNELARDWHNLELDGVKTHGTILPASWHLQRLG